MMMVCGAVALAVAGCADKRAPRPAADAKEEKFPPPPASSPMAKVQAGMTEAQVSAILGAPDDSRAYPTGKAFVPFYFGPDQSRFVGYYKGKGRVVFTGGNQWGAGRGKVLRVEYDAGEDGTAATK